LSVVAETAGVENQHHRQRSLSPVLAPAPALPTPPGGAAEDTVDAVETVGIVLMVRRSSFDAVLVVVGARMLRSSPSQVVPLLHGVGPKKMVVLLEGVNSGLDLRLGFDREVGLDLGLGFGLVLDLGLEFGRAWAAMMAELDWCLAPVALTKRSHLPI
jgi:hypothetical protein